MDFPTEPAQRDTTGMTFREFFSVVARWWWIILLTITVTTAAAGGYLLRQDDVYSAKADLLFERQSLASSLNNIIESGAQVNEGPRVAQAQALLAKSPEISRRAAKALRIDELSASELAASIFVDPDENSDVLHFTAEDADPDRAMRVVNEYAEQYVEFRAEMEADSIRKALRDVESKLKSLARKGQTTGVQIDLLEQKRGTLQSLDALQDSNAYVLRKAESAEDTRPGLWLIISLGATLGLVLGLGLAMLIDALDSRLRSPEDCAEALGVTLAARIPRVRRSPEMKPETLDAPAGAAAEAYRTLRANLDIAIERSHFRSLMVTGPRVHETKAAVAVNLAIAAAQTGRDVALIDLDLRDEGLASLLGISGTPGAVEAVHGSASVDAVSVDVPLSDPDSSPGVGKLRVVPRGAVPDDPGALVGNRRLREVISQLADASELVIIHAPALLEYSDPIAIATVADAVLIVCELDGLHQAEAARTVRLLDELPCAAIGVAVVG